MAIYIQDKFQTKIKKMELENYKKKTENYMKVSGKMI